MYKSKKHKNNEIRGFTIVELIVIIGIVGFISATVITGGNKGLEQRKVILESKHLVENIRKVQNMAMSSVSHECGVSPNPSNIKVASSGIILDTSLSDRYSLIVDCNENKIYDASDILLSTVFLSGTRITILSPVSPLTIFFIPPLPLTSVNTNTSTTAEIRVCGINDTTVCRYVYVNSRGSVTIQAH
ncbi:MAG: hypothetical protein AAB501_00075 [Patescibacteria group bacterium]